MYHILTHSFCTRVTVGSLGANFFSWSAAFGEGCVFFIPNTCIRFTVVYHSRVRNCVFTYSLSSVNFVSFVIGQSLFKWYISILRNHLLYRSYYVRPIFFFHFFYIAVIHWPAFRNGKTTPTSIHSPSLSPRVFSSFFVVGRTLLTNIPPNENQTISAGRINVGQGTAYSQNAL